MSNQEPVARLLNDEPAHRVEVVDALIHAPVRRFGDLVGTGPGVYALLFRGDLGCYERLRRPCGSDRSIVDGGGYPIYVGSALRHEVRSKEHEKKLATATDLDPADFGVIQLATDSLASARYAEELLLDEVKPLWGMRFMSGFGSHRQGFGRIKFQRPSPWSRFHQLKTRNDDSDDLAGMIAAHLEATVTSAAACENPRRSRLRVIESDRSDSSV